MPCIVKYMALVSWINRYHIMDQNIEELLLQSNISVESGHESRHESNSTEIKIPELIVENTQIDNSNKVVDVYSSANKNYITAVDIDNSNNSIKEIITDRTNRYIKKRLRQIVKQLKDERSAGKSNIDKDTLVSDEEVKEIQEKLEHDEETIKFIDGCTENIKVQKANFMELRKTMQDLNDLNEFSPVIEKLGLQKIDKFLPYEALIKLSCKYNDQYSVMIQSRNDSISKFVSSRKQEDITDLPVKITGNDKRFDIPKILTTLNDLYNVTKDMDDIELYERFNMESNIDYARKLSDICFIQYSNGDNYTNPVNESIDESQGLFRSLVKQKIVTNKLLGVLLSDKFVTNNRITCYENMYTTTFTNNNTYATRTIGELLLSITNKNLSKIAKEYRKQVYMTYNGTRPSTDDYCYWNGLQIYDIDLKTWNGNIDNLKQKMFEKLCDFHWFLWICKSSSGKGIHVYTKVAPAHHVYNNVKDNEYISRYWYTVSYTTKLNIVYSVLDTLNKEPDNGITFDDGFENAFVDNTVGRITSGIRLSYDATPLVNHNFMDLHPSVFMHQTLEGKNNRHDAVKLFTRKDEKVDDQYLKSKPNYNNSKLIELIDETLCVGDMKTFKEKKDEANSIDLSKFINIGGDVTEITPMERYKINYVSRYNVCNTLAALFGKDGLEIAHVILDSTRCGNVNEINSFYSCALTNKKQPTKLGLEILKQHGIVKTVDEKVTEVMDDSFKSQLKTLIERALENDMDDITFRLQPDQFMSDYKYELSQIITNEKINVIFSPAGSGKTQWLLNLAKTGKRVMLVLPYISVIKNKVETDTAITDYFDCYYGTRDLKQMEFGRNVVTTFDKFSRCNTEKVSRMFDMIVIDESHLLFTSSYRIEATSNVMKRIKELYYISSNDMFAAKICMMTGTSTGESFFYNNIGNFITFSKKSHTKNMEFLICDDTLDAITRLSSRVANYLNHGYKIMIPTNKGDMYSEKIIGMVSYLIGRDVKYGYYKRSNNEQEICRMINEENTVGDYDIIFCTNYLSVGIDINDKCEFASVYLGNFSGYEIEQFNARVRKTGIDSVYCVVTCKNDGTTNDVLLEEPSLVLRVTDEDQIRFIDDKAIAAVKQEFIASYDPVLRKISTPGFSMLNGKIQFNIDEYELLTFEDKYNECQQHPVKVARELAKYGYNVTVSTEFDGLGKSEQENLRKLGIAAARDEKIRKHGLLVGTYLDLVRNNSYINENGLEYVNVVEWIGKNPDNVIEDRDLDVFVKVDFDVFASPQTCTVKSKEALDKMYKPARYMLKRYSVKRAVDIIENYVDDSGILKLKNFQRAINLMRLIDSSDCGELAEPLSRMLEKMYAFVDIFEKSSSFRLSYETYKTTLDHWTNEYTDMLGIKLNSQYAFEKVRDSLTEMLLDVAKKDQNKTGVRFTYNKLESFDSTNVLNRRSIDQLIENMFELTSTLESSVKKIKEKHVVLEEQEF